MPAISNDWAPELKPEYKKAYKTMKTSGAINIVYVTLFLNEHIGCSFHFQNAACRPEMKNVSFTL